MHQLGMALEGKRVIDRGFYASIPPVKWLPKKLEFGQYGTLFVDHLRPDEYEEAYALVAEAGELGNNVGVDEFESKEDLRHFLQFSATYSLKSVQTCSMKCVIAINPQLYSRSFLVLNPALLVYACQELHASNTMRDIIALGEDLVKAFDRGFTGCLFPVFGSCHAILSALSEQNFHSVAILPKTVRVRQSPHLQELFLYYKHLGGKMDIEMPPDSEMAKIIEDVMCEGDSYWESILLPRIPNLPADYVTSQGLRVVIRNMEKTEASVVYKVFQSAISLSRGYGKDELISEQIFKEFILVDSHVFIVENKSTGQIIGVNIFKKAGYSRHSNDLCDPLGVLDPKYLSRGLGEQMVPVVRGIAHDLGFTGLLTDTVITNVQAMGVMRKTGWIFTGIVPNAVRVKNQGVQDVVLAYSDITNCPSFRRELCCNPRSPGGKQLSSNL